LKVDEEKRRLYPVELDWSYDRTLKKGGAAVGKSYAVVESFDKKNLKEFLVREGQFLLPVVGAIQQARQAIDEVIDVVASAAVEAVLVMSAQEVAGKRSQGSKKTGDVYWHGSQAGKVRLSDRKMKVKRPRLRRKGGCEVEVPAYKAMQLSGLSGRLYEILVSGVTTRRYSRVISQMAQTAGVSKSAVSREFVEESAAKIEELCGRRFEGLDILVIYIDGIVFGGHHVVAAVGVDSQGEKRLLGLAEGATENAVVVKGLLEDLVDRGLDPARRRLFVIDGSKALRKAIDQVFGEQSVQRCRNHKIENVTGYLPEELKATARSAMKAAYRLGADEGKAKLAKYAEWLEKKYPSAATSLLEGLEETFTINALGLPAMLCRCLGTTNVIENPNSCVRRLTNRVGRWRDGKMVLRWAAAGFLEAEKGFRKIMGYRDLWVLKAVLDAQSEKAAGKRVEPAKRAG